jgi:hypothetical protein
VIFKSLARACACLILTFVPPSPLYANDQDKILHDVTDLQWQNRLLLIWSEDRLDDGLAELTYEIDDRDLLWFLFLETEVTSNYKGKISSEFWVSTRTQYYDPEVKVILIGKDGGVKNRYSSLDMFSVFKSIDSMPMRQIEIENRKP